MKPEKNDTFCLQVKVYFEDTDVVGVVYHANYLKYMERARTEFLDSLGEGPEKAINSGISPVVVEASLTFKRAAKFNDTLLVSARILSFTRARVYFEQTIQRGDELICTGSFIVSYVASDTMKPRALTESLRNKLLIITKLTED